jgi:hypothetical protein
MIGLLGLERTPGVVVDGGADGVCRLPPPHGGLSALIVSGGQDRAALAWFG